MSFGSSKIRQAHEALYWAAGTLADEAPVNRMIDADGAERRIETPDPEMIKLITEQTEGDTFTSNTLTICSPTAYGLPLLSMKRRVWHGDEKEPTVDRQAQLSSYSGDFSVMTKRAEHYRHYNPQAAFRLAELIVRGARTAFNEQAAIMIAAGSEPTLPLSDLGNGVLDVNMVQLPPPSQQ